MTALGHRLHRTAAQLDDLQNAPCRLAAARRRPVWGRAERASCGKKDPRRNRAGTARNLKGAARLVRRGNAILRPNI
jgi:hypothetical protein